MTKTLENYGKKLGLNARKASQELRKIPHAKKVLLLKKLADNIKLNQIQILKANQKDLHFAEKMGLSNALIDRLRLTEDRLNSIQKSVVEIARLPNPLNKNLSEFTRKDGLKIKRVSVPIGSIFFIYESRPNVTIDGAALCLKSGNAVVLRGGKECLYSNKVFSAIILNTLKEMNFPNEAVQLVDKTDRSLVNIMLQDSKNFDLVIPRGGERLINAVVENSKIPVIKHFKGLCHLYMDKTANFSKSLDILVNAKLQRTGVCNAMETLLIDEKLPSKKIFEILNRLHEEGASLIGCQNTRKIYSKAKVAKKQDWNEEYLDNRLSVKLVAGINGAISHINQYGSGHTDGVLAESKTVQEKFINNIDSSSIMINASTRFADGGEYGLGAEVGISTDKLHARGPMGIESLTTYQWQVFGKGHSRK